MPSENRVAVFGYFDYALDVGHWPMLNQTQASYWELFDRVRNRAEQKHTILINSPHSQWRHEDELTRIKSILLAAGTLATGMCSVGMPQTRVLNLPVVPDRRNIIDQEEECPIAKAHAIIEQFETARCHQRSFAVVDGYFVTPHEYQLAKRFLQQQEALS